MDNFTILVVFDLMLVVLSIFTLTFNFRRKNPGSREWRLAVLFLSCGFILLTLQTPLPPVLGILAANYLILLGSYYQSRGGVLILGLPLKKDRISLPVLSLLFLLGFGFFIYFRFSTSVRIMIISFLLVIIYAIGLIYLWLNRRALVRRRRYSLVLTLFFSIHFVFYLVRIVNSALFEFHQISLYQQSGFTTVTFLYTLLYQLSYFMFLFLMVLDNGYRKIKEEKEKVEVLFSFLRGTAGCLDPDELYRRIQKILLEKLHIDAGGVYLINPEDESLYLVFYINEDNRMPEEFSRFSKGQGLSGRAIAENRFVQVSVEDYPDPQLRAFMKKLKVGSLAAVPITSTQGVLGAITIVFSSDMDSNLLDQDFFCHLGEQVGLVLQNAQLYNKVTIMANQDQLTGLNNRRKMMELLNLEEKRFRRHGEPFCLAMADIDFFKQINDRLGHECGDRVIRMVADILVETCRETDAVARWGGEEFLFLFSDTPAEGAAVILERIRSRIAERDFTCGDLTERRTVSIGVTGFRPADTIASAIARADEAMYEAKRNGKNRVVRI